MPRRSAEALLTIAPTLPPPEPKPPASLTAAQLRVWRLLLESLPVGWFTPAQTPLLVQLVRHSVRCDEIEAAIAATEPTDLDRYEQLCRLGIAASVHVNALCRSLRLTLVSTTKSDVAAHRLGGPMRSRGIEALLDD